jgi:hypothetical protein
MRGRRLNTRSWVAAHAADQYVSATAETLKPNFLHVFEFDRVGERSIGFLGRLGQARPPEHFNDLLLRY